MKEKRGDAFSDCHPAVNFFWFAAVILITMLNSHPVFLGISFLGAFCYASRHDRPGRGQHHEAGHPAGRREY